MITMTKTSALFFLLSYCTTRALALAESFDYIIVGAGTSGLVVANRLSEDSSVTVAVIEPGTDQRNNPNVTDWENLDLAFGTSINWNYTTTQQPGADNREIALHQGKAWGGTSTINGMTYVRGDTAQFDAWEDLGNPGWNWATLFPYYKKSEKYTIPTATQLAAGAKFEYQYHGFDGLVHVGYNLELVNGSFAPTVIKTWEELSLPHNPDLNSGDTHGFSMGPQTLDPALNIRWDAARAYCYPVENRTNLKIIKGTVKRITWAPEKCKGLLIANGVEFLTDDGGSVILNATKEVVISAGAVRTPFVLESSGIGNPRILESLGIDTKIDLPGVGENLIEQSNLILGYSADWNQSASNAYHTFATAADLFGSDVATVEASTQASLSKWAQAAVDASGSNALNVTAVEKLLQIQHDRLFKQKVTAAELLTIINPGGLLFSNYWYLLPFSRGSVHLGSAQAINEPLYDPRFFLSDFDMNATVAIGKLAQKYWLSEPINTVVTGPLIPGSDVLPNNATDEQWVDYVRVSLASNSHPLGTASMMSKELGGVVDPELRVYGTANVRVMDASVLPTQISGHLTATLYAVAERASEIIKRTSYVP